MSRRRKSILIAAVASLAILAGWLTLPNDPHDDVWEKYQQIHKGMSESEVTEVFGVPPGPYNRDLVSICSTGQTDAFNAVEECHSKKVWLFDRGLFEIGFDKDLRVQEKVASANRSSRPSVWGRLMDFLGY
jgi:hypothetical protein